MPDLANEKVGTAMVCERQKSHDEVKEKILILAFLYL